jgi:hypothetical protein
MIETIAKNERFSESGEMIKEIGRLKKKLNGKY